MAQPQAKSSKTGLGCLLMFALPFLAVGIFMTGLVVWNVVESLYMRTWQPTPCTIVKAELRESHDTDGTAYRAEAEYTYVFAGKKYTGTRVSLYTSMDGVGSFQRQAADELKRCQQKKRPFPGYVNPRNPAQSVLYRQLRWEMLLMQSLFALVFGGAGGGMFAAGLYSFRKQRRTKNRSAQHPQEPWQWRSDWAAGMVRASTGAMLAIAWCIALLWNGVAFSTLLAFWADNAPRPWWMWCFLGAFPLFGLGLLAWAIQLAWRRVRFGVATFQMAAVPGVIGGKLGGVIRIPALVRPERGFRVCLNCVRITQSTDSDSPAREEVVWEAERTIARPMDEDHPSATTIPVLFAIPYDKHSSDEATGLDTRFAWRLEVNAALRRGAYQARFEVPVFRTAESRSDFQLDDGALAPYAGTPDPDALIVCDGVRKLEMPDGGTRYVFPQGRQPLVTAGLTLFTLVWTGIVVFLFCSPAPRFFPYAFAFFEVLLVCLWLDLALYRSVVDVSSAGLAVRAGLLGLARKRLIDVGDIAELQPLYGMQAGTSTFHDLVVRLKNGKKITVAKRLGRRGQAAAILRDWKTFWPGFEESRETDASTRNG